MNIDMFYTKAIRTLDFVQHSYVFLQLHTFEMREDEKQRTASQ